MSYEEALNSSDPNTVKTSRGIVKGQITKGFNDLDSTLDVSEDHNYDPETVENKEIEESYKKLKENFSVFKKLHKHFSDIRKKKEDLEEEAETVESEKKYYDEVQEKITVVTNKYNEFSINLQSHKKYETETKVTKHVAGQEKALTEAKKEFEDSKEFANDIIKATEMLTASELITSEDALLQPAEVARDNLKADFENMKHKAESLREVTEESEITDITNEIKAMKKLLLSLEKVIRAQKLASDRLSASSSTTREVTAKDSTPITSRGDGIVRIKKLDCPKWSGNIGEFPRFIREFEEIVAVPGRNSTEVGQQLRNAIPWKHKHLVDNIVSSDWKEIIVTLTKKFGTNTIIVDNVVDEIEKLKLVTSDKYFVEFVERLERIDRDLSTMKLKEEIANTTILGKLESKLPPVIKKDWIDMVIDKDLNEKSSSEKFKTFMTFLNKARRGVEYQMSEIRINSSKSQTHLCYVTGQTFSTRGNVQANNERTYRPCLACGGDGKGGEEVNHLMEKCDLWNSYSLRDKEKKVKCKKHIFAKDHDTSSCKREIKSCKFCQDRNHHFLLCPKYRKAGSCSAKASPKSVPIVIGTDLAKTSSYSVRTKSHRHVLAMFGEGPKGEKYGVMFDNCSTDNYVTNEVARRHKLKVLEEVELVVEGISEQKTEVTTNVYSVPIKDKYGVIHNVECYGLDQIAPHSPTPDPKSYNQLCSKFGISSDKLRRPSQIDLLISLDNIQLQPDKMRCIENMALFDGPLGLVLGGSDPCLRQTNITVFRVQSSTRKATTLRALITDVCHKTDLMSGKELVSFFKEESIGVECSPKCGNCQCGKCPLGAKQMTLKDERQYDLFVSHMKYDKEGTTDDPGPYWRVTYPWLIPKQNLPDNRTAVMGVMNSTARKLSRDPTWRGTYENQLKDLMRNGFAKEITDLEVSDWIKGGGKVYYIAHQVALNPASKSTPVRVVFNSSQVHKGYSLNNSWPLGPDIMTSLHGLLLRFREDVLGAQGDIKKMYYMVRISKEEQMMQLFLWKFNNEDTIKTFAMTRLVMGNKPSSNFSQIAVKETTKLEDFTGRYPIASKALNENGYVDNVLITATDKDLMDKKITEIELVAGKGGFYFKPWIVSGEDIPQQIIKVQLPNAITEEEEKALGVYWNVKNDELYVKVDMSVGGGKKKSEIIPMYGNCDTSNVSDDKKASPDDVTKHNVGKIPLVLNPKLIMTLRLCLTIHAKAYDPLGFMLPTKMMGNLLFRESLQHINMFLTKQEVNKRNKIMWDFRIDEIPTKPKARHKGEDRQDFQTEWTEYFGMLDSLKEITVPRSMKPYDVKSDINPDLITFSDGGPNAYGTVAYVRWELQDETRECRLIMSKAKLGPLDHQGETVRNELSGATYASRLKTWIQQQSNLIFNCHYPFLDSRIVQDMIKKESYGFNVFAGLRVAEIQQKTDANSWRHIGSKENIADLLTRGVSPDQLRTGSVWQTGPTWLCKDESYWPVTNVRLENNELDTVKKYERVVKSTITCVSTGKSGEPVMYELDELIIRCGWLEKLIRATAYVLRLVGRHPGLIETLDTNSEKVGSYVSKEISADEYNDAWLYLISWEQKRRLDTRKHLGLGPKEKKIKLSSNSIVVSQVILSGRIKNFPVTFTSNSDIPILPSGNLAKLIVRFYHDKRHTDIDTVVAMTRRDVWILKARRLATDLDKKCVICKIKRKLLTNQLMGDLPSYRFEPAPAFSTVCMDLFGPITIKDDCVKRGPRLYKKVWGVLYTCTATRAVYLDIATDYSTESVLHTIRRLMAHRGEIRMIVSDPGSQLRGAAEELKKWRLGWDIEQLIRFGAKKSLEWRTIMPASQHQNGAAESMVKLVKGVKNSLMNSLKTSKLTLNEMNTLLVECANLVNERPIGIKPNSQTDPEYLSPNSLLVGVNSDRISAGPFQSSDIYDERPEAAKTRFMFVQRLANQFWSVWTRLYFPSLIIQQKWHHIKRNLAVGDICLLQDSNVVRGEWRYVRVTEIYPDRHGNVRNVEVVVAPRHTGKGDYKYQSPSYVKRHVGKLIVLVPVEDQEQNPTVTKVDDKEKDDKKTTSVDNNEEIKIELVNDEEGGNKKTNQIDDWKETKNGIIDEKAKENDDLF